MRIWIMPFAALMLGSCQAPDYDLVVRQAGSDLVIEPRKGGGPLGWKDDSIDAGLLAVYNRQGEGWVIEFVGGPGCASLPAGAPYPLVYGKVPRCFHERAPAPPIRPDVAYRIEAYGSPRHGYGGFRRTPDGVVALGVDRWNTEGEEWPDSAHPAYAEMENTVNVAVTADNGI